MATHGFDERTDICFPLTMSIKAITLALLLVTSVAGHAAAPDFEPIFNGHSLAGWQTPEPAYWTIEDGAITARITKDRPCQTNQYLIWTGGDLTVDNNGDGESLRHVGRQLADFELKLKSRLNGEGAINNGFQFRSRLLPDNDICGYQVDNNLKTDWLVRLYDEYGRHDLALRGERATFDQHGERTSARLHEPADPAWFKLEDWHEYHLICISNKITLSVDGRLACEVEDNDPRRRELQGILALQLHSGPPTVVQFKDIQLKILKPAAPLPKPPEPTPAQFTLQKQAAAWWPLDTGGHGAQPWLRLNPAFYQFQLNVRATDPNATPNANVILMQGAHFEADPSLLTNATAFTLHLRARDPAGKWTGALLTKQNAFELTAATNLIFKVMGLDITAKIDGDRTAWLDITARYDGSNLTIFENGIVRGNLHTTEPPSRVPKSPFPFLLAAKLINDKPTNHFQGELEHAALWSRALTDSEIAALTSAR
jgi:hypothetical protein